MVDLNDWINPQHHPVMTGPRPRLMFTDLRRVIVAHLTVELHVDWLPYRLSKRPTSLQGLSTCAPVLLPFF